MFVNSRLSFSLPIVIDIGGPPESSRKTYLKQAIYPAWSNVTILSVNINPRECPDIVDNAIYLNSFDNESVSGIYSSHTIEHISLEDSKLMFANWYRVLKPGSRIEIRCPDTEWIKKNLPAEAAAEVTRGRPAKYQQHKNMYWESKLIDELHKAGFINIRRIRHGERIPELDTWLYDLKHKKYHGLQIVDLVVEAYKPECTDKRG